MTIKLDHLAEAQRYLDEALRLYKYGPKGAALPKLEAGIAALRIHIDQMKPLDFDDYQIYMIPQGFEVHRNDFGDAVRDRIAFEVCSAMNVGCGSKRALMDLLYSAADAIIEQTNKAGVIWNPVDETSPDASVLYVLYRWREDENGGWSVGYGWWRAAETVEDGRWMFSSGHSDWPDGSEWMAIPI